MKGRPARSAPLPGTEPRPSAEEPHADVPVNETEPEAPVAAAAPPIAAAPAAEAPAQPEPATPPPDPRDAIYARSKARRDTEVAEALKDPQVAVLDTFAGKPSEAAATEIQPSGRAEPPAASAAPAQPAAGGDDQTARAAAGARAGGDPEGDGIKITVYGEEVTVSEDDVREAGIATLQKERAAEYRLKQAANQEQSLRTYHKDLDAYNERLKALEKDLRAGKLPAAKDVTTAAAPPSGATVVVDDVKLAEGARKFTEAVYKGDPKETAEALKALLADVAQGRTATPPPVDLNAVAEAAADVMGQRTDEQKRQAVNRTFATEFKSVTTNPEAFAVAQTKFNALLADPDNAGKPWEDLAREAGKAALGRYPELRAAPGKSNNETAAAPAAAPNVDATLEGRRTLKSKTVVRPSSSSARAPAPTPPPVRSNKQYIADIRKQRGLPAS